jgi:acyl-coenzyme A thioesterase PaaI-like protein
VAPSVSRSAQHPPSPPFFTRYGFSRTGVRDSPLTIDPYPEICRHGALRATVIASAVDLVGSLFTREAAGKDILYTTDLSIRIPTPGIPDRIETHGEVLRAGRKSVATGVALRIDGKAWAYGQTSFTRVPRPDEERISLEDIALPSELARHPLSRPLEEEVGIESVDPGRGIVEVLLRPPLLNPEGTMQGALVALLVEVAAERLAEFHLKTPQIVTELDLRYLSTARFGPVVAMAFWIGAPEHGMIRVDLKDRGNDDRLTATALVRVADARDRPF